MTRPKDITPTEAKELLDRDNTVVYLDVRSQTEFATGHVPGALNIPLAEPGTMAGILWQRLARSRVMAVALALFAGVALLLAAVGLYAVLAYYVVRRHREIGVRVALGAGAVDVVRLVLRRGLLLTGIGIAVGLGGAVGLTRFLDDLLFEVHPADPTTFTLVGLCFGLIALLACVLPVRRALGVDPVIVLKVE